MKENDPRRATFYSKAVPIKLQLQLQFRVVDSQFVLK